MIRRLDLLFILIAISATSRLDATVLTFNVCGGGPGSAFEGDRCSDPTINPNYGDRVNGPTQNGGRMQYGQRGEGWTPNIVVDYGPDITALHGTDKSYAGLWTVIWTEERSGELTIRLNADPGYRPLLYGLKIAGYVFNPGPWPLVVGSLSVRDQNGSTLWTTSNLALDQTGPFVLSFSEPLAGGSGGWLEFRMDVRNLPVGTFARESIGVDQVRFGQTLAPVLEGFLLLADPDVAPVPEPAAWQLLAAGLALLGVRRRGALGARRLARSVTLTAFLFACVAISPRLEATILVFDQCGGHPDAAIRNSCDGGPVNTGYGDRANAISANGGLFSYIEDGEGWTPNVLSDYGPDPASIYGWSTGYRSMANVLWVDKSVGRLQISLQADPGYRVLLYNFELAIFRDAISSLTVGGIRVRDQSGVLLLNLTDTVLTGSSRTFHFFGPAMSGVGGSLRIELDVTNLPVGLEREYLAIDNIRFGQEQLVSTVPEPNSALLVAAIAAIGWWHRRRS